MWPILDPHQYVFSWVGIPRAVVAFFGFILPVVLYFRDRNNRLLQLFLLVAVPAFVWQFAYGFMISSRTPEIAYIWSGIGRVGTYFLPAAIYAFGVIHTRSYRQFGLVALAYITSFIMSWFVYHPALFSSIHNYPWGFYAIHGPWHRLHLGYTMLSGFGLFYNLIRDFNRTASQSQRKLDWFFIIAFGSAYFSAFEFLPGYGINVVPVGFIAVSFWAVLILWAMTQHRRLALESIVTHTFSYVILSAAILVIFVSLAMMAKGLILGESDWIQILMGGIALLAIFPIADYFRSRFQHYLRRVFHRHLLTDYSTLQVFSEHLNELNNSRILLQEMVETLCSTTGVRHASVYLRAAEKKAYVLRESRGLESTHLSVSEQHPVSLWLRSRNRVLVRDLLVHDGDNPEIRDQAVVLLEALQAELIVPLVISGDLIGFLALGERLGAGSYDVNDIGVFHLLGRNAAVAISNSLLFEELTEKNRALVRLDNQKESVLANASHELRTPLHGIMGIAEALLEGLDGTLSEKQTKHVAMIYESGKALAELVEKLLHLQRLESQQAEFDIVAFELKDVLALVVPILSPLVKKKGVALVVESMEDLPVIYGDVRMVRQVLLNLLGNAIKFTESGEIRVSAWRGEGPRGDRREAGDLSRYVTISISDSGIGIRPEDRDVIFERFRQADSSVSRRFGGTGLGLAIVKRIVEAHRGQIWVESELGKGSTFFVSLPQFQLTAEAVLRLPPEGAEISEKAQEHSHAAEERDRGALPERLTHPATEDRLYRVQKAKDFILVKRGQGETVLVIDDNPINIEIVRSCLERHAYHVESVRNAEDAWSLLRRQAIDLVILDVMMPGLNGYEFCQRLRKDDMIGRIPVIMVTAKGTLEDKVYGLNVGADDYITKPFNKEELVARVNTFMRIKRMQDQLEQTVRELKTVSDIANEVHQHLDLDQLLSTILDRILDLVGADRGAIFTRATESSDLGLRFSKGFTSQKRSDVMRFISQELLRSVMSAGQVEICQDIAAQQGKYYVEQTGSVIVLPIKIRETMFGCIYLYSSRIQQLNPTLLRVLQPLSQQMSTAIDNARLYDMAITDDLTRLYLKRYFLEVLEVETKRNTEQKGQLAVLMIDIDHFKTFNDTYGHQTGDSVLVQVAELLQDSCRVSDVAARYGGEEFIVLLRNTDAEEAKNFAQRFRSLVDQFRMFHRGEKLRLTVSVGVAAFETPAKTSLEEMIGIADTELYKAKISGRNQVSVWDGALPPPMDLDDPSQNTQVEP